MRGLMWMILGVLAASEAGAAAHSCELSAQGAAPQRIELYTSEGCSSCPPADRWMSALPARDDRFLLAFHVDYWDDLGWPDRFADARYAQRQRQIAQRGRSRSVYTPEVVVEGREYRGWRQSLPVVASGAAPQLRARMRIDDQRQLAVEWAPDAALAAGTSVNLAVTEDGLYTEVRAGENRGARLRHDHVVRAFATARSPSGRLSLALPADLDRKQARVNLWMEDRQGRTVQSLSRPLNACTEGSSSH